MNTRRLLSRNLLLASILLFATTSQLFAQSLQRLSARFQPDGEKLSFLPALPGGDGGTVVFSPVVKIPGDVNVVYVTFSAQADVHNGSALLMNASVDGVLIQPLATPFPSGGEKHLQTGWYTLLILPQPPVITNCNDGVGGGSADCHDNTIYFSGCVRLEPGERESTVTIKLANLPGGASFFERATLYVDGQHDETGELCTPL